MYRHAVLLTPDQAPVVNAGPNQVVSVFDSAQLQGSISDDGYPMAPGLITFNWTQVTGPAKTSMAQKGTLSPTVAFSKAGTYVFRLSACDGLYTSTSDVTITVQTNLSTTLMGMATSMALTF